MSSADPAVPEGLSYHRLHALGRAQWPWALLGVLLLGVLVLVGSQVVGLVVIAVAAGLGGEVDTDPVNPAGLAWINLVWAAAIPLTWFVTLFAHRVAPRWLASVRGRVRWSWLATCLGLATVALLATLGVAALLPHQGEATVGGDVNEFTARTRDFVLVIVLLTPLQAAGEEYVFRGYLTQAFGGALSGRGATVVAVLVPAVLFALAHGGQDPPVFVDRFAFGLVAGTLVVLTGGLEASIAMHVLNNWLAFGIALTFGDLNSSLHPTSSTWWTLPTTLTQSLVYLGLAVWIARLTGVATRTEQAVLEGPKGPV